ncbi:MAG: arginine--tRNA ligase [Candidatus Peribacteraceae bacterium]|nr:arginine--tRNA ligase [Candidatus Peribacteraceae bacterium]
MFSTLSTAVQKSLSEDFGLSDVDVSWERPQQADHGDLATPVAMQVAKRVGKSPKEIAQAITASLSGLSEVQSVETAGPGYVNILLTPDALISALGSTREACTAKVKSNEAPIIIDYSQPNIAKPLGAHHLLSTLIGQSIGNLYEHAGYNTVRWNYLGDWGTQFGKLSVAVDKWGTKSEASDYTMDELLELYIKFHDEAEKDSSLENAGREAFARLESGDKELRLFWEEVVAITKKELSGIYERLNVWFDLDTGESYYEDKMDAPVTEGKEKGIFTEGEKGALIVEFPEKEDLPPAVVLKADGATIYLTRDLALLRHRISEWSPQSILFVVDVAQQLYFQQLFATVEKLESNLPILEHVVLGRMRFKDKSMSTRKGSIIKLEEVLDEAVIRAEKVIAGHGDLIQTDDPAALAETMGIGSVAYGVLGQNRKQGIVFDWDKMLSFEGNSAPYLQYTHARARSVVDKAGGVSEPMSIDSLSENERQLLNTLLKFEHALEEARKSHMPHVLANYLFELCQDYNSFYNSDPILSAEEPQRSLRVHLTDLTATVLKTGASLLTISVPDRM